MIERVFTRLERLAPVQGMPQQKSVAVADDRGLLESSGDGARRRAGLELPHWLARRPWGQQQAIGQQTSRNKYDNHEYYGQESIHAMKFSAAAILSASPPAWNRKPCRFFSYRQTNGHGLARVYVRCEDSASRAGLKKRLQDQRCGHAVHGPGALAAAQVGFAQQPVGFGRAEPLVP